MVHKTFVGRGGELETLEAHLQEALEGRGRVVLITGEAGIGKTTLVEHFRDQVLSRYPEVRFAGAECDCPIGEMDVGALSPYAPFKAAGEVYAHDAVCPGSCPRSKRGCPVYVLGQSLAPGGWQRFRGG